MGNVWDTYIQSLGKETEGRQVMPTTVEVPTQDINPAVRGLITEGGEPDMVSASPGASVANWQKNIYQPWYSSLSDEDKGKAKKGELTFPGKHIMGECKSCSNDIDVVTGAPKGNLNRPLEFVNGEGTPICRECYTKNKKPLFKRCERCHHSITTQQSLNKGVTPGPKSILGPRNIGLCNSCYEATDSVLPVELSKPDFIRLSVEKLLGKLNAGNNK
jgi:hypothetical protein